MNDIEQIQALQIGLHSPICSKNVMMVPVLQFPWFLVFPVTNPSYNTAVWHVLAKYTVLHHQSSFLFFTPFGNAPYFFRILKFNNKLRKTEQQKKDKINK